MWPQDPVSTCDSDRQDPRVPEQPCFPCHDPDVAEMERLVRLLLRNGYSPLPSPSVEGDVQLVRVTGRRVTVLQLARFGNAVLVRHEALYDPANPLQHSGQRLERLELDPQDALRRLVAELRAPPVLIGGVLPPPHGDADV